MAPYVASSDLRSTASPPPPPPPLLPGLTQRLQRRLDRLRSIVPHADRANTAAFLEEVINYIQSLQQRVLELDPKTSGAHAAEQVEGAAPKAKAKADHKRRKSDEEGEEDEGEEEDTEAPPKKKSG